MRVKQCPKCKANADELVVVVVEENDKIIPCKPYRKGWICFECRNFDQAIGRERVVHHIEDR